MNIPNALGYLPDLINIGDSILTILTCVGSLPAYVCRIQAAHMSFAMKLMFLSCTATRKKVAIYPQIFRARGGRSGLRAIAALGLPDKSHY